MSGSNDPALQAYLLQMRGQQRRPSAQSRLAEQMMASLNNPAPVYSTGAGLARVGSGILAGLMGGMAERDERAREDAQMQQIQDRTDKREFLQRQELAEFLGGSAPMRQQAPQMPAQAPQAMPAPMMGGQRGEAPQAVSDGIAARRALDPNSPTYAEDIQNINNGVIGRTLPGMRPQPVTAETAPPQGDAMTMYQRAVSSPNPLIRAMAPGFLAQANRDDARANRPPTIVSPGSTVLGPDMRPVFTAPRAPEAPSELDRLIAGAGLQPGSPEAQAAMRSILERRGQQPQTTVNVDNRPSGGETRFDQERGKTLAEEERAVVASMDTAGQTLRRLDQIDRAAQQFTTGVLSGARITAGQVAAQFGIPDEALRGLGISRDQVASGETIRSLQAQMLQGMIGPGGFPAANFSNADREMLERSLPGLQNSPQGNAAISAILRASSQRSMDIARSWNEYSRQNGASYQSFDRWTRDVRPTIQSRDILAPILEGFAQQQQPAPAPARAPGLVDRARQRNAPALPQLPPGFEVVQ